jgi:hypothetical protein
MNSRVRGFDRGHMELPANQTALLSRLADANASSSAATPEGGVAVACSTKK